MKKIIKRNPELFGVIIIILIAVAFGVLRNINFTKHGVITICRVSKFEPAGDGGDLYVEVYFKDKKYTTIVNTICFSCIGKYYYCEIIPGDYKQINLYQNKQVPECIITNVKYYKGWESFPTCDSF